MSRAEQSAAPPLSKATRLLLILVAVTVGLSVLYALQYYAGSPLRLGVATRVNDLAVSPDGKTIATATDDGAVRLWSVTGVATVNQKPVSQWAIQGDHVLQATSGGPAIKVAFDPSGATLFTAARDGAIRLWNVADGKPGQAFKTDGPIVSAAFSADGSTVAAVSKDGTVHVWKMPGAQVQPQISPPGGAVKAVALNADGTLLAAGNGADINIYNTASGQLTQALQGYWEDATTQETWLGHQQDVTALAFTPDGTMLASGAADTNIVIWDLQSSKVLWTATGHWSAITRLVFDPAGRQLLSASSDNKARSWTMPGAKSKGTFEGHLSAVNGVAFGPGTNEIISASSDGTIRQWDTDSGASTRVEWVRVGLLSAWGPDLAGWLLFSGVVGLVCLWGLRRLHGWSYLLALGLFLIGPIVMVGLPLLEVTTYPLDVSLKLQAAWPLLALTLWYGGLVVAMTRPAIAGPYEAPRNLPLAQQLMAARRTVQMRFNIFTAGVWFLVLVVLYSVLRRFNLDLSFMSHFFSFIMAGASTTLYISALSILLAVVLALMGALGRLSRNSVANGVSGFYISLIRGTPLLVQIYIWYLGLPRLGVILRAEVAGILALGVNYGAYMTEIFRAGIQAIGKGQYEAAQALGMTGGQTFRRIVLPQAFRVVIPPIGNEFIAMMKDSSLVSIMGIWELTFRAQKIGRQYFRAMETFMIAAAFYWLLTVVFQFLQGKLETYMARGERR